MSIGLWSYYHFLGIFSTVSAVKMHCLQTAPYQTVLLGNTGIREKIGLFIGFQPKWLK